MNSLDHLDDSLIERVKERFWLKVDKREPLLCWLWLGAKSKKGYGSFILDGRRNVEGARKPIGTHRISWMFASGSIPDGLHVLHHCDTPACVNPLHLFLGTNLDNTKDKMAKGRARYLKAGETLQVVPKHSMLPQKTKQLELSGMRFGKLTAIEKVGKDKKNAVLWNCLCDCGNKKIVSSTSLRGEITRSCGCLRYELNRQRRLKNEIYKT